MNVVELGRENEREVYGVVRVVGVPGEADVRFVTGSAAEGILVVVVEGVQVFRFGLTEQKSLKVSCFKSYIINTHNQPQFC